MDEREETKPGVAAHKEPEQLVEAIMAWSRLSLTKSTAESLGSRERMVTRSRVRPPRQSRTGSLRFRDESAASKQTPRL